MGDKSRLRSETELWGTSPASALKRSYGGQVPPILKLGLAGNPAVAGRSCPTKSISMRLLPFGRTAIF